MRGREAGRKDHETMRVGGGAAEFRERAVGSILIEEDAFAAEFRHERAHGASAHAAAEDGDGMREERLKEFGNGEGHQRSFSVLRPASAHISEIIQKRSTTLVSGQPDF